MNFAAFAVVVADERERPETGDEIAGLAGLGARNPWLAWPMTIAMLALAGIPGTVGFIGKFQLIHALVNGNYTWLAIVLVIGSMISLGYYLRVVATIWMGPAATTRPVVGEAAFAPIAGGSPEADAEPDEIPVPVSGGLPEQRPPATISIGRVSIPQPEIAFVALLSAAVVVVFGIVPSPLFNFAAHAGQAITGLF
jgi:NADH-quinone oxidoreductase subunit N